MQHCGIVDPFHCAAPQTQCVDEGLNTSCDAPTGDTGSVRRVTSRRSGARCPFPATWRLRARYTSLGAPVACLPAGPLRRVRPTCLHAFAMHADSSSKGRSHSLMTRPSAVRYCQKNWPAGPAKMPRWKRRSPQYFGVVDRCSRCAHMFIVGRPGRAPAAKSG